MVHWLLPGLPSFTGFYWVLSSCTGFNLAILDYTGFYGVLKVFHRVILGFYWFFYRTKIRAKDTREILKKKEKKER